MPHADIRVNLGPRGASLKVVARELRRMDGRKVKGIFKDALEGAAPPFVRAVRASALAIPTTGEKHTGLRARIAACAEQVTYTPASPPRSVSVAVQMNPGRMPPGEFGLPLYMEGVHTPGRIDHARWRHPVYGTWRANQPNQPSHPYFHAAADGYGRAAGEALKAALEDITRQLNG